MTEKLFYQDSHMFAFDAGVLECRETQKGPALLLDRTAFFPEGGGQPADTGMAGDVRVLDVQEENGEILHYVSERIEEGTQLNCTVDAAQRLQRMQSHSGEHIFSGITNRIHGLDNVGFHMGSECVTIDFNGELTAEQIEEIERKTNEAIRSNLPVRTWFPEEQELKTLNYRSKLELTQDVRLVEIPGVDLCACCAPHVSFTGEIGCARVIDFMRHRGGIRISLVFGMQALECFTDYRQNLSSISAALSVPKTGTAAAVSRLLEERDTLKLRTAELSDALADAIAASVSATEGNLCVFENRLGEPAQRRLVNQLVQKCGGIAAVFSGSDEEGYRYIIGSAHVDLRAAAKEVNAGIGGRGGGRTEMIQGSATGNREQITCFINSF